MLPATVVSGDDRLRDQIVVAEDPVPVLVEGVALPRRPHGHADRLGVVLLLEEDGDVVLEHVAEHVAHQKAFEGQPPPPAVPRRIR